MGAYPVISLFRIVPFQSSPYSIPVIRDTLKIHLNKPCTAAGYFFILYAFSEHGVILRRSNGGQCASMDKQCIVKLKHQKPHM